MNHFRAARRTGVVTLTAVLLGILAGCGGGGGNDGGTTPPPSGNPNPPQQQVSRLTLTGTVTDAPIANAVVTATVGSQTFTATADANGNYSLEISLAQDATGGFVTLSAKGAGSQSYVEFTSLLGTFSSLLTQAGSDATLSSTENFATQITNVSTALAVLLREANNGQAVASETLIQTLSASLNSQDVLDLATAIKLLVDHAADYPMPDGQASMAALLSNTAVREDLVDAAFLLDQATFLATQNSIVGDATLVKPVTPSTVPSNLLATTLPTDLGNTYAGWDRAVAFSFNAGGTGTATTGSWHRNMTWQVSGGSIDISFGTDPVAIYGSELAVCPEWGFGYAPSSVPLDYTLNGVTLRQLNERILAVTEQRVVTERYCGETTGAESVTVARTLIDASNTQTLDVAELRDTTRTVWVYDAFSDDPNFEDTSIVKVMPDIAQLHADGTGTTRVFDKQFTWALDASGKVVTATFTDGTVAKYRSLRDVDAVATDVLYDLALPTGKRTVGAGVSLLANPAQPFAFTPNNVVGRLYWLGVGETGTAPGLKGYAYRFDPDGTGSVEDDYIDAAGNAEVWDVNQVRNWRQFWHITNQELIVERHRALIDFTYDYECEPILNPECVVYSERRHIPLASNGARSYSLVLSRSDFQGVSEASGRRTYIAMYDHEPFGESAPSSKPMPAARSKARQGSVIAPARLKELRERLEPR